MRVRLRLGGLAIAAVWAAPGLAGPPGEWNRITEVSGRNTDEIATARTADGVLHLAWLRKSGTQWDLVHGAIDSSGHALPTITPIVSGWTSLNNPFLLDSPDSGLQLLLSGTRGSGPEEDRKSTRLNSSHRL